MRSLTSDQESKGASIAGGVAYVFLLFSGLAAALAHLLGLDPPGTRPHIAAYVLALALASDVASLSRGIRSNITGQAGEPLPFYPLLGYGAFLLKSSYDWWWKALGLLFFIALHIVLLTVPTRMHRKYSNGRSAVHRAALRNDLAGLRQALQQGLDPNAQDNLGETALHFAAAGNSPAIADELLRAGANALLENRHGVSPLRVATLHSPAIAALIENHA